MCPSDSGDTLVGIPLQATITPTRWGYTVRLKQGISGQLIGHAFTRKHAERKARRAMRKRINDDNRRASAFTIYPDT